MYKSSSRGLYWHVFIYHSSLHHRNFTDTNLKFDSTFHTDFYFLWHNYSLPFLLYSLYFNKRKSRPDMVFSGRISFDSFNYSDIRVVFCVSLLDSKIFFAPSSEKESQGFDCRIVQVIIYRDNISLENIGFVIFKK